MTLTSYKLNDLCDVKIGRTPPRKEFCWFNTGNEDDFVWVSIKDLGDCNKYISSSSETISSDGQKKFNIPIVNPNVVLLSFKLTVGRVAITTRELLTNEAIAQLPIRDKKVLDTDFLYYYLKQYPWKTLGSTSSIATAINSKMIKEMPVQIPDITSQRKIVQLLNSLDSKITINNKENATLEEIAKTLFSKFFESESEKVSIGSLPLIITDYVANGSFASLKENVKLLDTPSYAYFIRNTDLKDGEFNVYVDKHSYDFLSKSSLEGNEIIVSNVGDIGSVFLCPKLDKPMTLGNNVIVIKPKKECYRYFMYCWLKWFNGQIEMQNIKGGSAVPKFNKTEFKSIKIPFYSEKKLEEFNNLVEPLFGKITKNLTDNKRIENIINDLLPKLMSGEIDAANIQLEE